MFPRLQYTNPTPLMIFPRSIESERISHYLSGARGRLGKTKPRYMFLDCCCAFRYAFIYNFYDLPMISTRTNMEFSGILPFPSLLKSNGHGFAIWGVAESSRTEFSSINGWNIKEKLIGNV